MKLQTHPTGEASHKANLYYPALHSTAETKPFQTDEALDPDVGREAWLPEYVQKLVCMWVDTAQKATPTYSVTLLKYATTG